MKICVFDLDMRMNWLSALEINYFLLIVVVNMKKNWYSKVGFSAFESSCVISLIYLKYLCLDHLAATLVG